MSDWITRRERYGEAFWRAHHEAWQQGVLNQREYCEAHGLPLKAFGNWRAKFKAEPQPPLRKLLYRRGGLRACQTIAESGRA
ncbi:MAG: IS66 family insertion sequence element accessory protein TnpA [Terriglobia bacterium]